MKEFFINAKHYIIEYRDQLMIGGFTGGSSGSISQEVLTGSVSLLFALLSAVLGAIFAFFTTRFLKNKYDNASTISRKNKR